MYAGFYHIYHSLKSHFFIPLPSMLPLKLKLYFEAMNLCQILSPSLDLDYAG